MATVLPGGAMAAWSAAGLFFLDATAETAGPSTAGRLRVRSLLGGGEGGQFAVDR